MDKNTNDNLILKALARLQRGAGIVWDFTKNKVFPYIVAGSMVLTMAACTPKNIDSNVNTNQTDSSWSDTSGSTNDSNISSDSSSDTSSDNTTDSSTDSSTDTSKPNEDKLSKYSPLMQELFKDEYYASLIARAENNNALYNTPLFDPHPYAFLEDQGHDVNSVKDGNLKCRTYGFAKEEEPNTLYIATYVENAGGYYTEYLLQYSLTEQEMKDYKLLNSDLPNACYIHSMFVNDWISANKPAMILSEMNVETNTHGYIANYLTSNKEVKNLINHNYIDCIVTDINPTTKDYELVIFPDGNSYKAMMKYGKVCNLPMWGYGGTYYEGNILKTDETENYKYDKTKFDSLTPSESVIYNAQNFDFGAGTEIDLTKN